MSRIGKTIRAPRQSLSAPVSHDSDQARTRELKRLKDRVDELEGENERLREKHEALQAALKSVKTFLGHIPKRKRGKNWEEAMWLIKNALDGGGEKS